MAIAHLDADRMPPAVPFRGARVSEVVLLAQFVSDTLGGRPQAVRSLHDFRSPAGVVGDQSQRVSVHSIAARGRPRPAASATTAAADRRKARIRPSPTREWERNWERWELWWR